MRIEYKKKAIKYINSADRAAKKRLKDAIEKIPFGDIKKLTGFENEYRLRVGDLRVLFTVENNSSNAQAKIILNTNNDNGSQDFIFEKEK